MRPFGAALGLLVFLPCAGAIADSATPSDDELLQQLKEATGVYALCLRQEAVKFAKSKESADVVADGVMGMCTAQEQSISKVAHQLLPQDSAAADAIVSRGHETFRNSLIGLILQLRTQ